MQKYSVFNLIKNSFKGHKDWEVAWKDPTPKSEYDVIIIGGGGHGLATAYYLAKEHNITNVAIVEKGWIGGGNVGRNTTILRSNYMHDENGLFYEFGMDLWRTMSQDLNFNVMYSPRGIINLAHSDAQMNAYSRRGNSMKLNGIDAVLLGREEIKKLVPWLGSQFLVVYCSQAEEQQDMMLLHGGMHVKLIQWELILSNTARLMVLMLLMER